ncbi:hypothetical protein LO763_18775 [Glycomyces sp. A-F 0318]|uniref:DddA-like double-stranded DNA deaminase toxin n=1 Tax=Glycomyces amatae TaxID=2881355 RepID=UPI001E33994A|nr:DddA-like double-stranded DNA deaminase toxin [Glycomyces amatae]MCD0445654.1 hypothetical protein [Glycomyces amatae]
MASIGDVAARLRAALTLIEEAAAHAKAADDRLEGASASLQSDLAASSNPLTREGLGQWRTARERLAEALALIAAGTERMGEYVTSIAGGGSVVPSPDSIFGAARTQRSGTGGDNQVSTASHRIFDPKPYLDEMPRMPRRAEAPRGYRGKTEGRWVGGDTEHRDWASGQRDPEFDEAEGFWKSIRAPGEPSAISVTQDVEIKFAMFMRRHDMTEERIVINNPDGPCGYGKPNYRFGCDRLLPRFLKPGAKLTVVWPGGEQTYEGRSRDE